jgi:hypothetical protein
MFLHIVQVGSKEKDFNKLLFSLLIYNHDFFFEHGMKFGIFFSLNDQKNDHTIDMV